MILLHCPCGMDSTVDDSLAKRQVRCPGCNRILDVPPAGRQDIADQTPAERFGGYGSKLMGILVGLALLATAAIPFWIDGQNIIWSVDRLEQLHSQVDSWSQWSGVNWAIAMIVGMFAAGLILVIAGMALRRLPMAILYLLAGSILVLITAGNWWGIWQYVSDLPGYRSLGWWLWPVALGTFLLASSLRAKMGGRLPICLFQTAAAIGLALVAGYAIYRISPELPYQVGELKEEYNQAIQPDKASDNYVAYVLDVMLLLRDMTALCLLALASLFSLLHGVTFSKRSRGPAQVAVTLAAIGAIYWIVVKMFLVTGEAYLKAAPMALGEYLAGRVYLFHPAILLAALVIVPVGALSALIANLLGALGVRPTWSQEEQDEPEGRPAGPGSRPDVPAQNQPRSTPANRPVDLTPGQQLDRLKALLDQGKLSPEEYTTKRDEIMEDF